MFIQNFIEKILFLFVYFLIQKSFFSSLFTNNISVRWEIKSRVKLRTRFRFAPLAGTTTTAAMNITVWHL